MPTIAHLAVGMAAGRLATRAPAEIPRALVLGAVLATAPDWDLVSGLFGVGPNSPFVHRAAAHSLVVAAVAGLAIGLWLGPAYWGRLRTSIWAVLVLASHGCLDLFNVGGKVALLWPFYGRFLALPWQWIPAVESTGDLLTFRVVPILLFEGVVFAPLFLYAIWGLGPTGEDQKRGSLEGRAERSIG